MSFFWYSTSWIYSCLLLILKIIRHLFFSNIFSVLFFLFYFQDLNYPYARPFDIAQQLSHDLLLFVFSFVFFFSSLTLHFSLDDFYCSIYKDYFPCHVKSDSPPEEKSSSLTMSTYSCHLHFTYESIFFISMIESTSIHTHCSSFPLEPFILLPKSFHCPCQILPKLVNLYGCSVACFTFC